MRTVLIVAQSLDGFITFHQTPGVDWTSSADKSWFRESLKQFDASIMGRTTYESVRKIIQSDLRPSHLRVAMTRNPAKFADEAKPDCLFFSDKSAGFIVDQLQNAGHQNCAVLGGAQVHDAFLAANLVDEIWVTIEPRIFGQGTPLVQLAHDISLSLIDSRRLDLSDSMLLRYKVSR